MIRYIKYSKDELKNILDLHQKWLNKEPDGKQADLSMADLRGANLSNVNLRGASLRRANLEKATIKNADLSKTNLHGANLSEANLQGTDLSGADLRHANIFNANLQRSKLEESNLDWANMTYANLKKSNLYYASLHGAKLSYAELRGASMHGTNLREADLSHTNASGVAMTDAYLRLANLNETNFSGSCLTRTDFSWAFSPERANFEGAELLATIFTNDVNLSDKQKDMAILDDNFDVISVENKNIFVNDDYTNFDVCISLSDNSLRSLLLRSYFTDYRKILDSGAIVNTYLVADSSDVSLHLVLVDSESGNHIETTFRLQPQEDENEFALTQEEHNEICAKLEKALGMTPANALQKWAAEGNEPENTEIEEDEMEV